MDETERAPLPAAWAELMEALTLLSRGISNQFSPFHCEHDHLAVMADPELFTAAELVRLDKLGFFPGDEGTFSSFRFGSA